MVLFHSAYQEELLVRTRIYPLEKMVFLSSVRINDAKFALTSRKLIRLLVVTAKLN